MIFNIGATVSEIYSPPRITQMARAYPHLGIKPGFAMDLTTEDENSNPWDFDNPHQRARAKERILKENRFF